VPSKPQPSEALPELSRLLRQLEHSIYDPGRALPLLSRARDITDHVLITGMGRVVVPRAVLNRALRKARVEYVRVNEAQGSDPGPERECWAEFERLADYVEAPRG
jgi:hypothetical protein